MHIDPGLYLYEFAHCGLHHLESSTAYNSPGARRPLPVLKSRLSNTGRNAADEISFDPWVLFLSLNGQALLPLSKVTDTKRVGSIAERSKIDCSRTLSRRSKNLLITEIGTQNFNILIMLSKLIPAKRPGHVSFIGCTDRLRIV